MFCRRKNLCHQPKNAVLFPYLGEAFTVWCKRNLRKVERLTSGFKQEGDIGKKKAKSNHGKTGNTSNYKDNATALVLWWQRRRSPASDFCRSANSFSIRSTAGWRLQVPSFMKAILQGVFLIQSFLPLCASFLVASKYYESLSQGKSPLFLKLLYKSRWILFTL